MTVDRPMDRHLKTGIAGAALTIIGILASGPLALLVVEGVHPQPAWTGAEAFARAFHPVQTLPYYAGFILVAGCIILMSALCRIAGKEAGARYLVSLVFTTIFATLIFVGVPNPMLFDESTRT